MIKSIAVVGRDVDAWLAALMLQLSFGKTVDLTLVELPSRSFPQDFYTTLPAQKALHNLLGLSEQQVLSASGGARSLGHRYSGWADKSPDFFHVYDTAGAQIEGVAFIQYWIKARQRGLDAGLDDFSLAAAVAKYGKILRLNEHGKQFSCATYGYNLSALSYLKGIAKIALESGLCHRVAELQTITVTGGGIESLLLKDGRKIQADLFVDASGSGELIDHLDDCSFESWKHWFPCDRALMASVQRLHPMASFNKVSAFHSGWLGLYPLVSRTGLIAPFSSGHTSADEVLNVATRLTGMEIRQPQLKTLNTGIRRRPWLANCVAVGGSAASMDPVEGVHLHLLHTSLSYLFTLLPLDRDSRPERDMYNTRLVNHIERLRDFQLAHYALNGRSRDAFWGACAEVQLPDSLRNKVELFKACGKVSMYESETFQEESWNTLFAGSGLLPAEYDPLVDRLPESRQIELFQSMLRFIAEQVRQMPDMEKKNKQLTYNI